ncbi:MAG: hypothetical protein E6X52_03980 [Actinomyces sp.]|uniref:hypothetical protein n=1 Tax=Actinomyces sp. HMSC065F11 TaxID=1739395 RepID=UPI0008A44D2B|nr:hypothetical protein [Actinomyces sp. HMSC065F11]MDU4831687.1 hypothetical protein [Actinomyces sp.]OFR31169.1 hypothetical protein HMPREF2891_03735 [Actinomyces sp. HMSC065F11]
MADKNLMDRTVDELAGYVLSPEENRHYSDEDLKEFLANLGFPSEWPFFIPRLRGEVSWDYIDYYE